MTLKNPLVIALLASVLLNGILLGLTLAPKPQTATAQTPARSAQHVTPRYEDLPRYLRGDQRRAFDRFVRDTYGDELGQARKSLLDSRRTLGDALRAEPYDSSAVEAAMADVRAARTLVASISDKALNDFTRQIEPEARAEMLRRLSRRDRKDGKRGGRRDARDGENRRPPKQ